MSDSREKVMQAAEKFVARGKLDNAIREYRKLLRYNPNDANTLNRVGDLYARQSNVAEAVRLFLQIAENYSKDGFLVKAIAIYKKIIRLDPTQLDVYRELADLYHRQGLTNEARVQFQVVADYYLKHGERSQAIDVHRKMAEIEPNNPSHRVKLAELYQQEGLIEETIGEYQRIAEVMLEHGKVEEATKVYLRAFDLDAQDLAFVSEAVMRLREDGHAEAAEEVFQAAVAHNPDAARLDELMRSHVEEAGSEPPDTVEPPVEASAPADVPESISLEELEEITRSSDLTTSEVAAEDVVPADLATATEEVVGDDAIEVDLDELEVSATEEPPVVAATEVEADARTQPVELTELLAEAEVFAKYGLETKAVRRLEEVIEIDPAQIEAHRRLVLLFLDKGNDERVVFSAQRMFDVAAGDADVAVLEEVLGELSKAGYAMLDGAVVKTDAPSEAAVVVEPIEDEGEEGLEWLQESAEPESPGILFEAEEEFFDLAAELEKEIVDQPPTEAEAELADAMPVEEESLADIVDGFKKGVAEVLSPEAYDTHYNLGIAYREMELVDEAIGEFQLSAKDPSYLVDSCTMLGACFLEKGFPDLAVKWYKRGLEEPGLAEDDSLSLLYDLGSVYAVSGEREAAYEVFVEVYGTNSHYRDVVARLEELRGD
jgi:tetratricopeptide (TPR) repeat protein